MESNSKQVARAALLMAMTASREEENALKEKLREEGIRAAAVDYGGDALSAVKTIIERAVVAGKREFLIRDAHSEEGAVAGATHEAFLQVLPKALGLSIGGKIGLPAGASTSASRFFAGLACCTWTRWLWAWGTGPLPERSRMMRLIGVRGRRRQQPTSGRRSFPPLVNCWRDLCPEQIRTGGDCQRVFHRHSRPEPGFPR